MGIVNAQKRFTEYMGHLLQPGETITCVLAVTPRGRMRSLVIEQFGGLGAGAIQGVGGIIAQVAAKAAGEVAKSEPEGAPRTLAEYFPSRDRLYLPDGRTKPLLPNQIFLVITDRRYPGTCNNPGPIHPHHYILVRYPPEAVERIEVRTGGPVSRRTKIHFADGSSVRFDPPRGWTSTAEIDRAVQSLRAQADT